MLTSTRGHPAISARNAMHAKKLVIMSAAKDLPCRLTAYVNEMRRSFDYGYAFAQDDKIFAIFLRRERIYPFHGMHKCIPYKNSLGEKPPREIVYSLLITFFCQDFLPHLGQVIFLVYPIWGAMNTLLKVGT